MTAKPRDVVEFLLARLAETEAAASEWRARVVLRDPENPDAIGTWLHNVADHLIRDCAAQRQIVELWSDDARYPDFDGGWESAIDDVIGHLATVYADHPDYRDEWRPVT